jgi:hypothetical protein
MPNYDKDRQYKIVYLDERVMYGRIIDITDTHYVIETHKGIIHRKKENVLKIDPARPEYESVK